MKKLRLNTDMLASQIGFLGDRLYFNLTVTPPSVAVLFCIDK